MKLTFTLAFFICSVLAIAQPTNDTPCNAEPIEVDGASATGNNSDATADADEVVPPLFSVATSCYTSWCNDDVAVQNSMWYSFVAPSNGAVVISTCNPGSVVDSQIALWMAADCGDYSTYTWLAANDDIEGGCIDGGIYSSGITIDALTPGATYLLQIDGWSGEAGPFEITIETGVPNSLVNIMHTSADPALAMVDVRLDGALLLDNFNFLDCSNYIAIDASGPHTISIHPPTSMDGDPALVSTVINLNSTLNYEIAILGLLSETGFSSYEPLQLLVFEGAQLFASTEGSIPLHFLHASTDGPTVDALNAELGTTLCDNLNYGNFNAEGYQFFSDNFTLSIAYADGLPLGLQFCVPAAIAAINGFGYTIVAAGFVNTVSNNDGSALNLYVVDWQNGVLAPLTAGSCQFPANDNPCDALELIVNDAPTMADNSFATTLENESSPINLTANDPESDCLTAWCDGSLDNTLWFNFQAPASGCVLISTCVGDQAIDTQIALCTASDCTNPGTVEYLAANDDLDAACDVNTYASLITYCGLTPNETYFIQADGYGGEIGTFYIQVTDASAVSEQPKLELAVYPNPVTHTVFAQHVPNGSFIQLLNSTGRMVYSGKYSTSGIDVSRLESGAYMLIAPNGQSTRFIKL